MSMNCHLVYDNTIVATVDIPKQNITEHGDIMQVVFNRVPLELVESDYLVRFIDSIFLSNETTFVFDGKAESTLVTNMGVITVADIPINIATTTKSMDGLPDVHITSFNVLGDAPEGGLLGEVNATILNPSPFGALLPQTIFEMQYHTKTLGMISQKKLDLIPGTNAYSFIGVVNPRADARDDFSDFVSTYIIGKDVNAVVKGDKTAVPILVKNIQHLALEAVLPGLKNFTLLDGLIMDKFFIDFTLGEIPVMSGIFSIRLNMPFEFTYSVYFHIFLTNRLIGLK